VGLGQLEPSQQLDRQRETVFTLARKNQCAALPARPRPVEFTTDRFNQAGRRLGI
jgi:hypothetical protein